MFSPRLRENFLARKEFIDEVCLSLAGYLGSSRYPDAAIWVADGGFLYLEQIQFHRFLCRKVVPFAGGTKISIVAQPLEQSVLPHLYAVLPYQFGKVSNKD